MTEFDSICRVCPNGCHITMEEIDGNYTVDGHRCEKGLSFARNFLKKDPAIESVKIYSRVNSPSFSDSELRAIAGFWGIDVRKVYPQLVPQGSPERTLFRTVIEDDAGMQFVLEKIRTSAYDTKLRIAQILKHLSDQGLSKITPYLSSHDRQFIHTYNGESWQVIPFIRGVALNRETYLFEEWRGHVLADFLIEFSRASQKIPVLYQFDKFSLKGYIYDLKNKIQQKRPDISSRVGEVVSFLETGFMSSYDRLPVRFSHGDFHPMNIIWSRDSIVSVIDWEFCGIRPENYDLANMLGCLGIEDPDSLVSDLVLRLIKKLRVSGLYSEQSWSYLAEFVIAMRFAWLSEWLRKSDEDMISLELDYMDLLISNRERLFL